MKKSWAHYIGIPLLGFTLTVLLFVLTVATNGFGGATKISLNFNYNAAGLWWLFSIFVPYITWYFSSSRGWFGEKNDVRGYKAIILVQMVVPTIIIGGLLLAWPLMWFTTYESALLFIIPALILTSCAIVAAQLKKLFDEKPITKLYGSALFVMVITLAAFLPGYFYNAHLIKLVEKTELYYQQLAENDSLISKQPIKLETKSVTVAKIEIIKIEGQKNLYTITKYFTNVAYQPLVLQGSVVHSYIYEGKRYEYFSLKMGCDAGISCDSWGEMYRVVDSSGKEEIKDLGELESIRTVLSSARKFNVAYYSGDISAEDLRIYNLQTGQTKKVFTLDKNQAFGKKICPPEEDVWCNYEVVTPIWKSDSQILITYYENNTKKITKTINLK